MSENTTSMEEPEAVSRSSIRGFSPPRLRTLRQRAALTQERLAMAADVSPSVVGHWESGIAAPAAPALKRLAEALGVETIALTRLDADRLRLTDRRNLAGLTQAQVAAELGLSASGYATIERGARKPRAAQVERLAEVLKCSPAEVQASWNRLRHAEG